jgi:BirA family biotin operon repressor/biotin-[acetyl-CoA-carboxylase] ligase
VALARALEARAELPATIQVGLKWPNDLLLEERAPRRSSGKVGGILVELTPGAAIVGVGLNVTLTADELPPPPLSDPEATRATSLAIAGAKVLERETLLIALATELSSAYRAWCSANGDPEACGLAAEYTRLCRTVGRSVRAHLPDATQLDGVAHSVDAQGRLVIEHDRTQTPLAAADVVHLR